MTQTKQETFSQIYENFIHSKTALGVSDITIRNYRNNLHSISKHLNIEMPFAELDKRTLEDMIVSMRGAGLAHNTISTYVRSMRTFLSWCRSEGLTNLKLPNMKDVETVKETYSDSELALLLKRPRSDCDFCEFRNWTIVNFLLNSGCRAASVRNIQNRDVDLEARQIILRHNKNHKLHVVPLCSTMTSILRSYMAVRQGKPEDYLFCNQYGEMLSENALRLAIGRYNNSRGVQKTSIHLFRHTFARKYLVDCGGDAFTLQKLMGHSTLKMTKHYCAIFDSDISKNYDRFSPLAQLSKPKEKIKKHL